MEIRKIDKQKAINIIEFILGRDISPEFAGKSVWEVIEENRDTLEGILELLNKNLLDKDAFTSELNQACKEGRFDFGDYYDNTNQIYETLTDIMERDHLKLLAWEDRQYRT